MVRACERVCRVPCKFRVARERDAEQNAGVEEAVLIAQQEATEWEQGLGIQALAVAAIIAAVTAAAAFEAAATWERCQEEAAAQEAAAAREAPKAQEAVARREAEVKGAPRSPSRREGKKGSTGNCPSGGLGRG